MMRVMESMQKVGEVRMRGYGRQRKSGGESGSEGIGQTQVSGKMSSSSILDSVIGEDPFTKYKLLHELGWRTMLVVPELEREVKLLWRLRDTRKVVDLVNPSLVMYFVILWKKISFSECISICGYLFLVICF